MLGVIADTAPKGTQGSAISLWIIVNAVAYLIAVVVYAQFLPDDSSREHI